ncbi:2Fe-2S ferredoxin-type iron-sulfur binding domain [Dillenia turbinata]|uniref:xanthine dehydrogenase n=1 Tax=Dillenia turbinata TaxID=194707 RepID=A0AAN8VA72_9MAGN
MGSLMTPDEFLFDGKESASEAILYVNGVRRILPDGLAHLTLLEYLRDIGLTGTKLGCGEGGCGACTVMVSSFDQTSKKCLHYAVNACLCPLYSVEGMHVITVEGIGNRRKGLHPIQESLARSHGTQCGFCTPGFIMSLYALLRSCKTPPSEEQIEESLGGNLCRCTGYRPIVDAFQIFAKTEDTLHTERSSTGLQEGEFTCPSTGKPCSCGPKSVRNKDTSGNSLASGLNCRPISYNEIDGSTYTDKEFIFPPELLLRKLTPLNMRGFGGLKWYRPLKLNHLLELKARYPDAKFIVGNTEVGIEMRLKRIDYKVIVSVAYIPELNTLKIKDDGLEIGAAVRVSEFHKVLKKVAAERAAYETSACKAFIEQIKWFAGTQIRNVASVGGNICHASPISDLNPLWMAARARFQIIDCKGNIRTVLAENFFLGYRKVDLARNEILLSIFLPWTRPFEYVKEFKQAHRRDDDIALVNAGMRVHLKEKGEEWVVSDASIAYGGVAPVPLGALKTNNFLIGKSWDQDLLNGALDVLGNDILMKEDAPGGMVEYRKSLTLSFFFKFFLWVSHQMDGEKSFKERVPAPYLSAVQSFSRPTVIGNQDYEIVTGEAEYTDDVELPPNGLHAALILGRKPHARILSIDDSEAKRSPGVVGIYYAKDVPGDNRIGPVRHDEELFATEFVKFFGQVNVEYEELPAILSIQDALKLNSFIPDTKLFANKGDVDLCFQSGQCDHIIEGEVPVSGQEHFYLETQSTLIWTTDYGNEVHMLSSSQCPPKHQAYVASVLDLPMSKVVCKTKRIGGGFGGKETRSAVFAAAAAVPAYLLNRPVKIVLDRDEDMMITGQRHSFLGKYKVGFTNDGKLLALDLEIYNNGGSSLDMSFAVLERAVCCSDNVYEIPNMRVLGKVLFSHIPTNTAFRGFGSPQAMLVAENWIQRIAMILKKSPEEIREINFQGEGSVLHFGQILENWTLDRIWSQLKSTCNFSLARKDVDEFNSKNRWRKRGIAMIPTKFGISFGPKFLNQGAALVQLYTDGTVLVTHGGVEMGQGLHTKVSQIAASAFNIPLSSVFVSETSTDKVPNASPTAASASSDLYGGAVLDACQQLVARMEPIKSKNNFASFAELVTACYHERVNLSAQGFYVTPGLGYDWKTGKGILFRYFTYGAAFAEVEIDTLTGDFHTRKVDLIMDLGHSLNPAIDVGQIEGAFVQGLGWVAFEEIKRGGPAHKWLPPGYLFTCGPGNYKIPSMNDLPFKFSVSLLKDAPNKYAVHSSKAVGEPPFFLASAVFFAIKDAIVAARAEVGRHDWFPLDNPATPERIRMACVDDITARFADHSFRPKLSY